MIVRQAVRALLVSEPGDELLMVTLFVPDSGKTIWLAPGGGIESGEDHRTALNREVWEETGLDIGEHEVQGPVWHRRRAFRFRGQDVDQAESYYLVRTPKFEPTAVHNADEVEAELLGEYRWWTLPEIEQATAAKEIFVPLTLAEHFQRLLEEVPDESYDVGL